MNKKIFERLIELEATKKFVFIAWKRPNQNEFAQCFIFNEIENKWATMAGDFFTASKLSEDAIALAISYPDPHSEPMVISIGLLDSVPYRYDYSTESWMPSFGYTGENYPKEEIAVNKFGPLEIYNGEESHRYMVEFMSRMS